MQVLLHGSHTGDELGAEERQAAQLLRRGWVAATVLVRGAARTPRHATLQRLRHQRRISRQSWLRWRAGSRCRPWPSWQPSSVTCCPRESGWRRRCARYGRSPSSRQSRRWRRVVQRRCAAARTFAAPTWVAAADRARGRARAASAAPAVAPCGERGGGAGVACGSRHAWWGPCAIQRVLPEPPCIVTLRAQVLQHNVQSRRLGARRRRPPARVQSLGGGVGGGAGGGTGSRAGLVEARRDRRRPAVPNLPIF